MLQEKTQQVQKMEWVAVEVFAYSNMVVREDFIPKMMII